MTFGLPTLPLTIHKQHIYDLRAEEEKEKGDAVCKDVHDRNLKQKGLPLDSIAPRDTGSKLPRKLVNCFGKLVRKQNPLAIRGYLALERKWKVHGLEIKFEKCLLGHLSTE